MTKLERELLTECQAIASRDGLLLSDVLGDCHKFWAGPGRSINPRGWRRRADAAARLVARMHCLVAYESAGLDAAAEIDGFDNMTAAELADEIVYLADHQG